MMDLTKTEKTLNFVKSYVYPFILIIIGMTTAWSLLNSSVHANFNDIVDLEISCDENEQVIDLILQRLASIDTKLDFILEDLNEIK